ncbi:hypothetical protein I4U23_015855 [Adineta vaga]|nr:hypothetical protein I4U23_015855 [Adineta vaga]
MRCNIDRFFSGLGLSQCTQLRMLTIYNSKDTDLQYFLRSITNHCLTSLKIDLSEDPHFSQITLRLISSILAQHSLLQCSLNYLCISYCTTNECLTVLTQCPYIQTFIIRYHIIHINDSSQILQSNNKPNQQLNR